jgi:AcrR family transcriptional regulator
VELDILQRYSPSGATATSQLGLGYAAAMAWDTEGTRRRLKEAATAEFAERGPDGTTMARIAGRAGINKERLYKYFGDKRALFETVLCDELEKLAGAATPTVVALEDVGEWAGRTFDYHAAHPELARLLQWEGLAGGPPADGVNRTRYYQEKVQAVAAAQRDGVLDDALDPAHLVFLIIALAAWWVSVPQLARMLTGADASDPAEQARRRACVVTAARQLAAPR